jgi:hypothetical protein
MPFKAGDDPNRNSGGRPKGRPNKTTQEIKEAYQQLLESNLDNMSTWLARMASEDEGKALDYMLKLSEYILPKLARQEITGQDGKDLFKDITFKFGDTEPKNEE